MCDGSSDVCSSDLGRVLPVVHGLENAGSGPVTTLRLRDGERELSYPVGSIVDIVQMPPTPDLSCRRGIVAGVTLLAGRQYEVIDSFRPFAWSGEGGVGQERERTRRSRWVAT